MLLIHCPFITDKWYSLSLITLSLKSTLMLICHSSFLLNSVSIIYLSVFSFILLVSSYSNGFPLPPHMLGMEPRALHKLGRHSLSDFPSHSNVFLADSFYLGLALYPICFLTRLLGACTVEWLLIWWAHSYHLAMCFLVCCLFFVPSVIFLIFFWTEYFWD